MEHSINDDMDNIDYPEMNEPDIPPPLEPIEPLDPIDPIDPIDPLEPMPSEELSSESTPESVSPTPTIHTFTLPLNLLQGLMNMPMDHQNSSTSPSSPSQGPTTFEERFMNNSFHQQPKFKHVASKDFINSLSVQKVSPELVEKKTTCALCLDELILGEDIIELPCKDKHYFHIKKEGGCPGIYPWLKENNTCPMCRHQFPFEEKEIEQESVPESGNPENPIRLPRLQVRNPREIRQIVYQVIEDEEERMLQEALYASLNE